MTNIALGIISLLLALVGIILRKTYFYFPIKELQRRARHGDDVDAERLYRAASYGRNLRALLWLYTGFFSALSFVLFAREFDVWLSVLIIAPSLYIVFSLIPTRPLSDFNIFITRMFNPIVVFILYYCHPLIDRGSYMVNSRLQSDDHSKLYEPEDLIDLLKKQSKQHDNRIGANELKIAINALKLSQKTVGSIMTPANKVKVVKPSDTIGPVFINEVYESKSDYVVVKEGDDIVGYLAFKDLSIESKGQVKDIMSKPSFLNEDDDLDFALNALNATGQSLFIVLTNANEYVGIISLKNVTEILLGKQSKIDPASFYDRENTAQRHKAEEPEEPVSEPQEVVE
ncbi:MAG TPA: CBS domain-containing protein [Candidatus Sulfotelmatobacter sp.]|nr:CBS domain-containing protein [Candidatus Sulfotelmatobacter sp.]